MKLLVEYLERAGQLELLAASERDIDFKEQLSTQAQAYRKLAAKRARDYGLPDPSPYEAARAQKNSCT
ncbi:hypothetical protein ACVWZ4_004362 [Bradyrhizobium sp. USDA 4472]